MPEFQGIPDGKINFTRLPSSIFSELLPQIDHLGELKVTLYALWKLEQMEGDFRYLTEIDFLEDSIFLAGMGSTPAQAEAAIIESVDRAVQRGTFLRASVNLDGQPSLIFFNTPKGRAAVDAIQRGEWRPSDDERKRIPIELAPPRPTIYDLYEQNIGVITPLMAETLRDAADEYPADWIEEAVRIAVEKNVRNWRYVEAILRRWQEKGYDVRESRKTRRDTENGRRQYADWEEN
jgi:DNA replication protein